MNEIDLHTAEWRFRDSFEDFFREAWKVIEPETKLVWNWHHSYLCEQLKTIRDQVAGKELREHDTIINVPPGTMKSSLITIAFPVWCWISHPWMKFLTMSYNADLAIKHAVMSRDIIESDWFRDHFGHLWRLKYDVNKKSEYANNKGGNRIAFGVKGGATGKHGDILICDDPMNPKMANSQVQYEEVNRWWDNTIYNRMTNPEVSHKVIVMQRLSVNDLTGHCMKKQDEGMRLYRQICLPAQFSSLIKPERLKDMYTDGLLDRIRLTANVLKRARVSLGSNDYSGQYQQNPIAEEGNLVRPEWFKRFRLKELEERAYQENEQIVWNVFIDGAYTEDRLNDPTALLCAGVWENDLYIRDVDRVWMELPELIKHVPGFLGRNKMNGESAIVIEPKASGHSIAQMLKRYTDLNVVIDKPPKDGKTERMKSVLPFIESGRVYLEESSGWVPMLVDELKAFPFGEHDDIADTLVMAITRMGQMKHRSSVLGMKSF